MPHGALGRAVPVIALLLACCPAQARAAGLEPVFLERAPTAEPALRERLFVSVSQDPTLPAYELPPLMVDDARQAPPQSRSLNAVLRRSVLTRRARPSRWLENLSFFGGVDGSKQPQDLGVNGNLGGRFSANWGLALLPDYGVGLQIGTSLNYSANALRMLDRLEGTASRFQNFTTVGIFQRTRRGWNWALAYDFLAENYYDRFDLGQWRGLVGYQLNARNEAGSWFAVSSQGASGLYGSTPVHLKPISMANAFWRHTWLSGAQTMLWAGMAAPHSQLNAALGDLGRTGDTFVTGGQLFVPLNPSVAIFGQANLITPASTGAVDAFIGFSFFPGGSSRQGVRGRFSPMLPVANNPMFAVDASR